MTFVDFVSVSIGNLWRMKLRTFLTVSGVVIAIAAFVSMLSFGAGNQQYLARQFEELGLLTTMQAFPKTRSGDTDTVKVAVLDQNALDKLAKIPGVRLAYPYEAFAVHVKLGDSLLSTKAQALSQSAISTKLFSRILVGKAFDSDSAHQALVSDEFLKNAGFKNLDSLINQPIVLTVRVSSIDSGLAHVVVGGRERIRGLVESISADSLLHSADYRRQLFRTEVNSALGRFIDGFLNARAEIADTLIICGILEQRRMEHLRMGSIIIPVVTAKQFTTSGFTDDPASIFVAMSSGNLFPTGNSNGSKSYPQVTLDLDPHVLYKTVRDSVEAMGFRAFSFAEQFDEIRRFFFYFDLALGVVGLIALITASLGIINTMVMSILERKREIGVLKSLGADDLDIRFLFLAESGMIGVMGAVTGIIVGWLITRLVSVVARTIMVKQGIPEMEMFALPVWLISIALAIGIGVSILAGLFPAARAARVDPVEALRNE